MFSLIIVDYNSINETMDYINRFIKKCVNCSLCHPILIDNYETNENCIDLLSRYGDVKYISNVDSKRVFAITNNEYSVIYCWYGENAGFARGNNLGAKISEKLFQDDYYIFSNNDIILKENFDIYYYKDIFSCNKNISVIGPRVTTLNGMEQSPCKKISTFKQLFVNYWAYSIPLIRIKNDLDYDGTTKICYWVSGCFMLIRADIFKKIEGFDEGTFLYAEEMILSEKMLRAGYSSFFDNNHQIIHLSGSTTQKQITNIEKEKIRFRSFCYYQSKYRNANEKKIKLAKINFKLYIFITRVKNKIRQVFQKIKKCF